MNLSEWINRKLFILTALWVSERLCIYLYGRQNWEAKQAKMQQELWLYRFWCRLGTNYTTLVLLAISGQVSAIYPGSLITQLAISLIRSECYAEQKKCVLALCPVEKWTGGTISYTHTLVGTTIRSVQLSKNNRDNVNTKLTTLSTCNTKWINKRQSLRRKWTKMWGWCIRELLQAHTSSLHNNDGETTMELIEHNRHARVRSNRTWSYTYTQVATEAANWLSIYPEIYNCHTRIWVVLKAYRLYDALGYLVILIFMHFKMEIS